MRTRVCFRLNKHYDADLIAHLEKAQNISRELRRITRAGIKALQKQGRVNANVVNNRR